MSLFFLDVLLFLAKSVAILCLALLLYNLGSGLFGNSRSVLLGSQAPGSQSITEQSTTAQSTTAQSTPAQSTPEQSTAEPTTAQRTQAEGSRSGTVPLSTSSTTSLSELPNTQQAAIAAAAATTAAGAAGEGENVSDASFAAQLYPVSAEAASKPEFERVTEPEYEVISLADGLSDAADPEAEADRYAVIDMAPVVGELWLQQQQPGDYTVQYGTSTSVALLEELTGSFPIESDTIIFQFSNTNENQEPVFGIVHGVYSSAADARKAIEAMPAQLVRYQPWVRRIDQIREVSIPRQ